MGGVLHELDAPVHPFGGKIAQIVNQLGRLDGAVEMKEMEKSLASFGQGRNLIWRQ